MNGGLLPLLLICVTLGLSLALAPWRMAWFAVAAMTVSALLLSLARLAPDTSDAIFVGLWLSVIVTAVLTYLPRRYADRLMIPAGLNAGAWAGALSAVSDKRGDLILAIGAALLFIPARWFTLRGYHIVIKVVASWMIAIASLSMFVSFMPTPGYKPDHME